MADNVISGYAVRFHDIATIANSWRERIAPGAFTETLKGSDVVALLAHDTGRVLGRQSSGSLTLREDRIGLWFSLNVDPSTPSGQEALGNVRRQDIKGCSFAGQFLSEEWKEGGDRLPLRTVTQINLFEITLTAFPAYETTNASVRATNNFAAASRRRIEAALRLRRIPV